ncbi:MAG: hemin uptake protein HemP [Pseudomonadota bacterium]
MTVGDLMGDARQLGILHEDRRYVLRLTRQNKLILTRDERADPTPEQQR